VKSNTVSSQEGGNQGCKLRRGTRGRAGTTGINTIDRWETTGHNEKEGREDEVEPAVSTRLGNINMG